MHYQFQCNGFRQCLGKHTFHFLTAKILLHPISDHLSLFTCFEVYQHKSIYNFKIRIFNSENISNFHNTLDFSFDINVVLRKLGPNLAYFCFVLFAILILHSRESELYRYTLDGKSTLAWELPFSRFMGHLSST